MTDEEIKSEADQIEDVIRSSVVFIGDVAYIPLSAAYDLILRQQARTIEILKKC